MGFTKFKLLTQRLLSGLGKSKSFFPFYDSENDADYRVSLDTLITFISNELGVSSKAVFELTGVSNTGNNYISTLDISSYKTEGLYIFKPSADSDNTSSLNVNSVGILDIKEFDGTDLVDKIDLKAVNTYLLLNKTSYWLVVGGVNGGTGGVSTFSALTDSPYDNILLAEALDSKQDRLAGIVSGCEITVETFSGTPVATNKQIKVSKGLALTNSWYIPTSEYSKLADTISSEITLCPTGGDFKYYDIVADTSGAITIHEGTPSTAPAHYVIIDPLTEVLLGFITVGDAVIEVPTPVVGGYIPLSGSNSITGDLRSTNSLFRIGNSLEKRLEFGPYGILIRDERTSTDGIFQIYNDGTNVTAGISVSNPSNSATIRGINVILSDKYEFFQDIIKYTGLTHLEIAAKIDAEPYGLITKEFADANYLGSLTQSSQAQVEAAFDNTNQTTPVVLEQTSALTPFNAWWLVQKVKTWVSTTANQTDSANKRFVTDAEKVVIGNTSNTNSGNETASTIGALLTPDSTPLDTDLVVSWDGTLLMKTTWTNIKAFLKTYFDPIYQQLLVSGTNIKTVNGSSVLGSGDLVVTGFTTASVAEVNTGSDNTKGATPLNLETSKYLTQNGTKTYATTGGTSTAYTVTLSPAITAYATGSQFNLVAHTSNTTTTPTINFNGLGAKNIVDRFGNAIGVGDFQGNLIVRYNGTSFNIIGAVTTMAANTVKGNNTGSTASAVDLTTDQFTAMMEIAVAVGTTGIITAMTSATYKYIRLTSASATALGSIADGFEGKELTIYNNTGVALWVIDNYASEVDATKRIQTGTGYNVLLSKNCSITLRYDNTSTKWIIKSGTDLASVGRALNKMTTKTSVTGTTTTTILNSVLIKGGDITPFSRVVIIALVKMSTSYPTIRLYYNTTASLSGAGLLGTFTASAGLGSALQITRTGYIYDVLTQLALALDPSQSSQGDGPGYFETGGLTVNFANDCYFILTTQNSTSGGLTESKHFSISIIK